MPARERRAGIVAAAGEIALDEGLEHLTLRRVADHLGVVPGLVSHYFPAVDDLVTEAFGAAVTAELAGVFAVAETGADTPDRLRLLLAQLVSRDRDRISLLWIDAWHAARRRPGLLVEVRRQMAGWHERLAMLIQEGADRGELRPDDARSAAARILAVVDGMGVQAVVDPDAGAILRRFVVTTAERETGLPPGALSWDTA